MKKFFVMFFCLVGLLVSNVDADHLITGYPIRGGNDISEVVQFWYIGDYDETVTNGPHIKLVFATMNSDVHVNLLYDTKTKIDYRKQFLDAFDKFYGFRYRIKSQNYEPTLIDVGNNPYSYIVYNGQLPRNSPVSYYFERYRGTAFISVGIFLNGSTIQYVQLNEKILEIIKAYITTDIDNFKDEPGE